MMLILFCLALLRCVELPECFTNAGLIAIVFTDGPVKGATNNIFEEADDLDGSSPSSSR